MFTKLFTEHLVWSNCFKPWPQQCHTWFVAGCFKTLLGFLRGLWVEKTILEMLFTLGPDKCHFLLFVMFFTGPCWTVVEHQRTPLIFTTWTQQKNWETVEAENSRYLVFKLHSPLFAWTVSPQKNNNHNTKTTTTTPKPLVLSDAFSSLPSRSRFVTTKTTSTTATVSPPMLCSKHVEGHMPSGRKLLGEEVGSTKTQNPKTEPVSWGLGF